MIYWNNATATHPSFNRRRSSFSGRCCQTVEHSAAERHVGVVNVVFSGNVWRPISSVILCLELMWWLCSDFVISETVTNLFCLLFSLTYCTYVHILSHCSQLELRSRSRAIVATSRRHVSASTPPEAGGKLLYFVCYFVLLLTYLCFKLLVEIRETRAVKFSVTLCA